MYDVLLRRSLIPAGVDLRCLYHDTSTSTTTRAQENDRDKDGTRGKDNLSRHEEDDDDYNDNGSNTWDAATSSGEDDDDDSSIEKDHTEHKDDQWIEDDAGDMEQPQQAHQPPVNAKRNPNYKPSPFTSQAKVYIRNMLAAQRPRRPPKADFVEMVTVCWPKSH
jgi:hypothetical protein